MHFHEHEKLAKAINLQFFIVEKSPEKTFFLTHDNEKVFTSKGSSL